MRAVTAARSRRRGGTAEAVAADSGGDRVGERKQIMEELTAVRFEAEDGRERELGVEGRSSMADGDGGGGLDADLAGERLERPRDGAEEVDSKVTRLWARRIEAGWRGLAGETDGGELCSA